eukprot:jgi/Botrbrau1/5696/Bobra.0071s0030.2
MKLPPCYLFAAAISHQACQKGGGKDLMYADLENSTEYSQNLILLTLSATQHSYFQVQADSSLPALTSLVMAAHSPEPHRSKYCTWVTTNTAH